MPSQQWYFARDNQQQGPVSEDALRDMLKSNQLSRRRTDMVRRHGRLAAGTESPGIRRNLH